jgi:phosphoglycolate phosphatase
VIYFQLVPADHRATGKKNMIKLIIFDWDDVFSQGSTKGYFACYHAALVGVGVTLDPGEEKRRIQSKWGQSHREEIKALLLEHPDLVDAACDAYEENLFGDTFVSCLSIIPGSVELLAGLAKRYTLALASGVHPRILRDRVIPTFHISDVFAQIITAYDLDDPTMAKPHPHIAQTIMATQGCTPEETIMVGDATNDVMMARNAGIEPVVVLTGHLSHEQAEALNVEHIIADVTKLETILDQLA